MANEEDVEWIALALPATSKDPAGFRFFVSGKQFAWSYMERVELKKPRVRRSDVLVIRVADEHEKDVLLTVDPATFFTTAHYDGYPAILVRLPAIECDELQELLTAAWRHRAPRRLVREFDASVAADRDDRVEP